LHLNYDQTSCIQTICKTIFHQQLIRLSSSQFTCYYEFCTGTKVLYAESTAIRIDFNLARFTHQHDTCNLHARGNRSQPRVTKCHCNRSTPDVADSTPQWDLNHTSVSFVTLLCLPIHLLGEARCRSSSRNPPRSYVGFPPVGSGMRWYCSNLV
jgi:hypothetical protein